MKNKIIDGTAFLVCFFLILSPFVSAFNFDNMLTTPKNDYDTRYYNPILKRFTQPDTIIPDLYNPQSLNRYSYVMNNPYKYTDNDGHNPLALGALIGAVVGAAVEIIKQELHGASMFDGSMDWGEIGESALIGAGAGLAGGAGYAAVGEGMFALEIAGATSTITGQALSNIASDRPIQENVGIAGGIGAGLGGVFGLGGKIISSFKAPSVNLGSGAVQEFPMSELYGTHQLQKEYVLTAQKIKEGIGKGPIEIYNYNGDLIIGDGMGRTAREYLLYGKTIVKGRILNADPADLGKQEVAANMYKWKNDESILKQLEKLK